MTEEITISEATDTTPLRLAKLVRLVLSYDAAKTEMLLADNSDDKIRIFIAGNRLYFSRYRMIKAAKEMRNMEVAT